MKTVKNILILLVISGVVIMGVKVIKTKRETLAKAPSMKSYAMVVSSIKPVLQDEVLTLPYLAIVQSEQNVALSSRISSRIKSIVKCGNKVHKGDILVELDASELNAKKLTLDLQILNIRADIIAKKSMLDTNIRSHARTKELLAVKGASQERYDEEASNIAMLKAGLTTLNNQIQIIKSNISQINTSLSYTTLKSPIDGVASQCFANVGDISVPTKPLLNIESKNGKYLLVRSAGNTVAKSLKFNGIEYPLIPMSSTYNGLNEYRAYLDTNLSSATRVNVSLLTYKSKGMKLPLDALLQKDSKTYCFVINADKATPVELTIIAQGQEGVIVEGLQNNKEIVIAKPDILLKLLAGVFVSVRN